MRDCQRPSLESIETGQSHGPRHLAGDLFTVHSTSSSSQEIVVLPPDAILRHDCVTIVVVEVAGLFASEDGKK